MRSINAANFPKFQNSSFLKFINFKNQIKKFTIYREIR